MATKVGQEIELECRRCKEPRNHVVSALGEGGRIEMVVCSFCHTQRRCRKAERAEPSEPGSRPAKSRARRAPVLNLDGPAVPYSLRELFEEGALVDHPKFGRGRVQGVRGDRIDVRFRDGSVRVLMHGR